MGRALTNARCAATAYHKRSCTSVTASHPFLELDQFLPEHAPSASLDPADFRKAMGHFPTGVCVVAVEAGDGAIEAMTINSFVSVSLEPLLVCWSLHNNSSRFDMFAKASRFTISILAEDQAALALAYASRGVNLVREGDFAKSANGMPVIVGALGSFECSGYANHRAGDHTMILGEVTGLTQSAQDGTRALGFYKGEFCAVPQV